MITFSDALAYARALKINRHATIIEFSCSAEGDVRGTGLASGEPVYECFPVDQTWSVHSLDGAILWDGIDADGRNIEVQLLQFNGPAPEVMALSQKLMAAGTAELVCQDLVDEVTDQCRAIPMIVLQEIGNLIATRQPSPAPEHHDSDGIAPACGV